MTQITTTIMTIIVLMCSNCQLLRSTPAPSTLNTDQTRQVLLDFCRRNEPEGNLNEQHQSLCDCLATRHTIAISADKHTAFCKPDGKLTTWLNRLEQQATGEGTVAMTATDSSPLTPEDQTCLADLVRFQKEIQLSQMNLRCHQAAPNSKTVLTLIDLPEPTSQSCWVMSRMTKDGCITTHPCKGTVGEIKDLPLDEESKNKLIQSGRSYLKDHESLALCHEHLRSIHALKDPAHVHYNYNLSFANFLTFGRSSAHVTNGPANCHGTAQAVAGGILDETLVTKISYHSDAIKTKCSSAAEVAFTSAKNKSSAVSPLAKDLPIERGGYLINMNHDATCDETNCGTTSFSVYECSDQRLNGFIFFEGMCINCWTRKLVAAGYRDETSLEDWRTLKPGCVLTANDHSIAFLMESQSLCYYYESTSPYGPPLLRVNTCPVLYQQFPRRYCPKTSHTFHITD